ncbi:MAG: S8 family serine peptidase, partial [Clostridiales bacterium]|nr:S8 family serine peptidase [Clostridiales bacterium]
MNKFNKKVLPLVLVAVLQLALSSFAAADGLKLLGIGKDPQEVAHTEVVLDAAQRIMVRYKAGTAQAALASAGNAAQKTLRLAHGGAELLSETYSIAVEEAEVENYKGSENVEYVEVDAKVRKASLDEYWNMAAMSVPAARDLGYSGEGVKIALLDTGIDTNSSQYRVAGGVSFVDGVDGYADDHGHGTTMASVMAGDALGIAPGAELYAVKVLDRKGEGRYSGVIQGIYWAIEQGVDIISMSFGADEYSLFLEEAIDAATEAGITMIAAAGNTGGTKAQYPARYPKVIGVGASGEDGGFAEYSNTGDGLNILAPGESIAALSVSDYGVITKGTSVAAAQAAGVAALAREAKRDLTVTETMAVIKKGQIAADGMDVGVINAWKSLSNINLYIENAGDYLPGLDVPGTDGNGDGTVTASAANLDEYDFQYGNPNQPVTIKANFNSQHSNVKVTVYKAGTPSTILHTQYFYNINGTVSKPVAVTYTCPSGTLSATGTYNVRFHASSNTTTEYDNVYTVYITNDLMETESNDTWSNANTIDGFTSSYYGRI